MRYIFLLFFLFLLNDAEAQVSSSKKASADYEKAQQYLKAQSYKQASDLLLAAISTDPSFQAAYIDLAEVKRLLKEYKEARTYYQKAIDLGGALNPRVYYGLGDCCLNTGDYGKALESFEQFLKNYSGSDADFVKLAKKKIIDCQFSIAGLRHPYPYAPVNLGVEINSPSIEYFPAVTADGASLIFSRTVQGNEDFYVSDKKGNKWTTATPLSNTINTAKYNEGAQSITPDGKYLFFTGCNRPDGLGRCDIYVSRKEGTKWGEPFNLGPDLNSTYWDSQPAVSPDGNTLYFVSNRPGGQGGYDIWKSVLGDDGYWKKPVNLGPEINTPFDEQTPFMHPDGTTLYFSSNGWPGFGNMDIFYSRLKKDKWTKPVNIGYPINTFNEENGLVVMPDGDEGLFSAKLEGGYGDMDLYSFKIPEHAKPDRITYVKGVVMDEDTKELLEAQVQVRNLNTDTYQYNDFTTAGSGDFLAVMPVGSAYSLNVTADGYLFYSDNFDVSGGSSKSPVLLEIFLKKIKVGKTATLRNIFFDTNKYELLPQSLRELMQLVDLMNKNSSIHIEIQGHTDNVGNDESNTKLSLARAKSVYEYLLAQGVDPGRLTYKGFGERTPIADNKTEEGRKANRRTTFVITRN